MVGRLLRAAFPLAFLTCGLWSCGNAGEGSLFSGDSGTGMPMAGSTASGGSQATGPSASTTPSTPVIILDPTTGSADAGCVGTTSKASLVPVDLHFMIDVSASMLNPTATGETKWAAVKTALEGFIKDPASSGIGVALQYFPHHKPEVPFYCSTNAECGAEGRCLLPDFTSICYQVAGTFDPNRSIRGCQRDNQCQGDERCLPYGFCTDNDQLCPIPGETWSNCGLCQGPGSCVNKTICSLEEYTIPKVAMGPLPGNEGAFLNSLATTAPIPPGSAWETNTGAALEAAVAHASSIKAQNPAHTVAVVLVTDGVPNQCFGFDIATDNDLSRAVTQVSQVANAGFASPGTIRTFVIGVLDAPTPGDSLDAAGMMTQVAQAGGTERAFVLDPMRNVTGEFSQALESIRAAAVSCEYQIPAPPAQEKLDYFKVNIQVQAGGPQASGLLYVAQPSSCDPVSGGWYYDADPQAGQTPSKILLCPQTCSSLQNQSQAQVDVQLGCVTRASVIR